MPFGLMNAPAVFQRLMGVVLYDVYVFSRAYIDDAVVLSSSWEKQVSHLNVNGVLPAANIWYTPAMGRGRKRPDDCKVAAIRDFLLSLLSDPSWVWQAITGNSIPRFSFNSSRLTDITRKSAPESMEWTDALQAEFSYL